MSWTSRSPSSSNEIAMRKELEAELRRDREAWAAKRSSRSSVKEEKEEKDEFTDPLLKICEDHKQTMVIVLIILAITIAGLCIWFFILKKPEKNIGGKKKKKK